MKKLLFLLGAGLLFSMPFAYAQPSYSGGYAIGDKAVSFSLKNVDGRMVSLDDYDSAKGYVIIFTCNTCPYSRAYESRIKQLHEKYASGGFPVLAINPNDPEVSGGDAFDEMKQRAGAEGFEFPYLYDENQEVSKIYGPLRTPHVFLLEKTAEGNIVRYVGAIDNDTENANPDKVRYVEEAISAILKGSKPDPASTKAIGCGVKWQES
ncbi:peroxiredoxin [Anseongella ginsenosidimutans]|uniref:Peroxiredoxin n=1 Tax=Anseongella ginsenosidimutans TaxID=496056 RepID=A0A4R3KT16_9SPHI|nr:thioredoxin family protein [Anseongella ginsenosidimutans]QEC52979.1 thioredoxin family protein [Anseongella ginsenosidimutans]TCS87383.1 peroxiredoxin [Anseongella ginsenosidimutans]